MTYLAAHNRCVFSQSQIKRTLSHPSAISYVAGLLDGGEFIHRTELAEFLCEEWRFEDARSDLQLGSCVKAPWGTGSGRSLYAPVAQARTGAWPPRREKFAAWH